MRRGTRRTDRTRRLRLFRRGVGAGGDGGADRPRPEHRRDVDIIAKQTSRLFGQIRPRIETIHEDITAAGEIMGRLLLGRIAQRTVEELQYLQKPETHQAGAAGRKPAIQPGA